MNKKCLCLLLALFMCLGLFTACADKSDPREEITEFSFSKVVEYYSPDMPGIRDDGFVNTESCGLIDADEALELARKELRSDDYNDIRIGYDSSAEIWKVSFGKHGTVGGGMDVYLDSNGRTILMIAGE